jgi:phage shock protein C
MSARRLYRSRSDRRIAGVCGGLAEYFNIDPTIVRLVWAVLILGAGVGLLAYVLFWIIVPSAPAAATPSSTTTPAP